MLYLLLALLIVIMIFGPQLWARWTFSHYNKPREDIPGTGGELARHLLKRFGLDDVGVETTDRGDHYDPKSRCVRLSPDYFNGRSLTAIAVAAHETGHALQHHSGERLLALRTRLVVLATSAQQLGAAFMVAMPIITAITRLPHTGLLMFALGVTSMGTATIVHLVTLPVEWDASFGKALPILRAGEYISEEDEPAVRRILRAAALTYFAASLASLLNLWRWLALLRRR
jgi:Zn-dependent membrane protease YugP